MHDDHPFLTIAIPTYNRPEQIQKQVRRILPQLSSAIILNIYDNHSQKPVVDLFTEEEKKHFTIIRNPVNIGGDANIARCFEYCTTKWLWILSDDDPILDNIIETVVIKTIRQYPNACFINFTYEKDYISYGLKNFLSNIKGCDIWQLFAISLCLYNVSLLKNHYQYLFKNISLMIAQLILVLKFLQENKHAMVIRKKCIIAEDNNTAGITWSRVDFCIRATWAHDICETNDFLAFWKLLRMMLINEYIRLMSDPSISKRDTLRLLKYYYFRLSGIFYCQFPQALKLGLILVKLTLSTQQYKKLYTKLYQLKSFKR